MTEYLGVEFHVSGNRIIGIKTIKGHHIVKDYCCHPMDVPKAKALVAAAIAQEETFLASQNAKV